MWPYLSRKELVIISPKFPHDRKHLKTREEHIIPFRTSKSFQPRSAADANLWFSVGYEDA